MVAESIVAEPSIVAARLLAAERLPEAAAFVLLTMAADGAADAVADT